MKKQLSKNFNSLVQGQVKLRPLPMPVHPILEKHEQDIQLYEALLGPVLGDLIFAMVILSDVQHELADNSHIVEELNEAKALMLRGFNFIIRG